MAKTQHTHRGTCQVCGREQAADNQTQRLALHGYTTQWGYFMGTCHGSRRLPLQLDHSITDETIGRLGNYAAERDQLAAKFESGEAHPEKVEHPFERVRNEATRKWEPLMLTWEEANEYQRRQHVERLVRHLRSEAKAARDHGRYLHALKASTFGKPLVAAEPKEKDDPSRCPGSGQPFGGNESTRLYRPCPVCGKHFRAQRGYKFIHATPKHKA